jgi:hypothetical protein
VRYEMRQPQMQEERPATGTQQTGRQSVLLQRSVRQSAPAEAMVRPCENNRKIGPESLGFPQYYIQQSP